MAPQLEAGWIRYFAPYEEIHRSNVAAVLAATRLMLERRPHGGLRSPEGSVAADRLAVMMQVQA